MLSTVFHKEYASGTNIVVISNKIIIWRSTGNCEQTLSYSYGINPAPALFDVYPYFHFYYIYTHIDSRHYRSFTIVVVSMSLLGAFRIYIQWHYCNDIFILPKNTHKYTKLVYLHNSLHVYSMLCHASWVFWLSAVLWFIPDEMYHPLQNMEFVKKL